jgi:YfiH family protein
MTGEARIDGPFPHIQFGWVDSPLVVGTTTRELDFGRRTRTPTHRVEAARESLRAWARGRFDGIVGSSQVHGTRLFRADLPEGSRWRGPDSGEPFTLRVIDFDGFHANTPGILLTVGIADCVPALVYAPSEEVIALLHAGWRGVAGGILKLALQSLEKTYGVESGDCRVWWGPAIGPCCYPVGEEVTQAILRTEAADERGRWLLEGGAGESLVDLRAALTCQAEVLGVPPSSITASRLCTACRDDLFHSYRRDGDAGGRMLTFAGMPHSRG